MKRQLWLTAQRLLVLAFLLAAWDFAVLWFRVPVYMLPTPLAVGSAIAERFPSLMESLWITTESAAVGLAASVVLGVAIALLFAQWRWLRRLLYPYTILLQTVPIVAVAPLILLWVGNGTVSVSLVACIVCLAPIIANATQGMISVDANLVELFLMQKTTPTQILFKLRLPHSLPNLFVGIRISAGIAVIGAITGELFAGSSRVGEGGLGYSILYASGQLETDYLFALVVAATVLGFSFFFIGMFLEWYFLHHWHESNRSEAAE